MNRKERYTYILNYFKETLPNVATELNFGSAFQLLVATLLSAQCTDKRVNEVTPELFRHYPDAETMSKASFEDILEYVKSVSYPNAKSQHLLEMSQKLVKDFNGVVPSTTEELTTLAGVGRKTANVVQAVWFGKPTLAVDTHVYRVSHRLGLVPESANTPTKVEDYLMKNIPLPDVSRAHHWLLLHGRYVCKSLKPNCSNCPFAEICPSADAKS
ncbi:MAG: endonuclease III [Prevotella sp.]|nr:endonuclease III [Prevotella sp.]